MSINILKGCIKDGSMKISKAKLTQNDSEGALLYNSSSLIYLGILNKIYSRRDLSERTCMK
jgi:hypothetical protein